MLLDLKLIESGSGGDLVKLGNDLVTVKGFQNMPYLALFGGNPEQSTTGPKIPDEQAFDYWGNQLLSPNAPAIQFNSIFEGKCKEVPLTSFGRLQLEQAVKKDLSFMQAFAVISSEVKIVGVNTVQVSIRIQEPQNKQSTEFVYIWDGARDELTTVI